jgi:hypothetical protein
MAFLALTAKPTPAAVFSSRTRAPTVDLSDLASCAAQAGRITNHPELNAFVKEPAREGWRYGENL